MATFNSNATPSPFGSSSSSISPDLGPQFFMGCTVVNFDVSADWSSQGGSLNVSLLEDTHPTANLKYDQGAQIWYNDVTAGSFRQRIMDYEIPDYSSPGVVGSIPVIGSAQTFKLVDSSLNIVFQYDGILQEISRNASPNSGKIYTVRLSSPLNLLKNCSMLLSDFTGYGHAKEGFVNYMSQNQYYQLTSVPTNYSPSYYGSSTTLDVDLTSGLGSVSPAIRTHEIFEDGRPSNRSVDSSIEDIGITFGTNNRSLFWDNVYNVQNIFGIFENDSDGILNYSRFGGSRSSKGLRFDMICYALHELINNNPTGSPLPAKRTFGGNIIGGAETYNINAVINGSIYANPYFYGLDILSFYDYMVGAGKISADYIYEGSVSSTVLDFISKVCDDAGVDFIIELHKAQTTDASDNNYWDGTQVTNYTNSASQYTSFPLLKSYLYSRVGGVISIKILDRRFATNLNQPFSSIAYTLLGYEVPDYGDKNIVGSYINPGDPNPFTNGFEIGAFGPTYLDPLDDDYYQKGTDGSSPFGGKFPVSTQADQNQSADLAGLDLNDLKTNPTQTQVAIRASENPTAKFVVGGLQSRVVYVPQKYIYQYWGEIKTPRISAPTSFSEKTTQQRSIPVITPILEHNDIVDFIPIDMQHIFPATDSGNAANEWLDNIAPEGIYLASVAEIRSAMSNKNNWLEFIEIIKPCIKYSLFRAYDIDHQEAIEKLLKLITDIDDPGASVNTTVTYPDTTSNPPIDNAANYENIRISTKHTTQQPSDTNLKQPSTYGVSGDDKEAKDIFDIINEMHSKIKEIGDTHYGKSWVAWSPQITTKVTEDVENYGQYEHSWKPSNSAYLEPSIWDTFEAPQHNKFMDGGKVLAYSNFPAGFVNGTGINTRTQDTANDRNDETITLESGVYALDFSSVSDDSKFQSSYLSQVHTKIQVDTEYVFVPYDYFYWYSRDRKPIVIEHTGSKSVYDINYQTGPGEVEYPILKANTNYSIYDGVSYTLPNGGPTVNKSTQDSTISSINSYTKFYDSVSYTLTPVASVSDRRDRLQKISCNDNSYNAESPTLGVSNTRLVYDFINLICPDHGVNCITFTKFTTPAVYFPKPKQNSKGLVQLAIRNLFDLLIESNGDTVEQSTDPSNDNSINYNSLLYSKRTVPPTAVGIPQQSTRHRYGPWFTTHNFLFGGQVESIVDDTLVPENYIFPLYGTLPTAAGSYNITFAEQLSGFVGMNYAGESIANSIDGYGQFALEEGSITLPGAPTISRIGDALFSSGPYVTELSVRTSAEGIETSYSFNSAVKKSGKTNSDVVKQIRNISTRLTGK